MREKTVTEIVAIIAGVAFIAWVYWDTQNRHSSAPGDATSEFGWVTFHAAEEHLGAQILLPCPSELQQIINRCPDVNVVVDGKLGPKSTENLTNEFRDGYEAAYMYQTGVYNCKLAGM